MLNRWNFLKTGFYEGIKLEEVQKPNPRDDEVLIKVHAASVNSWDWDLLRGTPFLARLTGGGLLKPRHKILGTDIAGRVEALGRNVKRGHVPSSGVRELVRCLGHGPGHPLNIQARKPIQVLLFG